MNLFSFLKPKIKEVIKEKIVYKNMSHKNFDSARFDRLTLDFLESMQQINDDIKNSLTKLRGRSRTLAQNDDYYKRCLQLWVSYIVGPKGLTLVCKSKNNDNKDDKSANDQIERDFKRFCNKKYFSKDKSLSFLSAQNYEEYCFARDGETFTRIHRGVKNEYGVAFSFIDPEFLDETYCVNDFKGGKISQGIQFDGEGSIVGYWFNDPKGYSKNSTTPANPKSLEKVFIPADQIIHRFNQVEPNQIRGFPVFQNIMLSLFALSKLNESEMVNYRYSSCKMATIESDFPDEINMPSVGETNTSGSPYYRMDMLEPGIVEELEMGKHLNLLSPDHKTGNWDLFSKGILRSASSGSGFPYCLISNDYSGLNSDVVRLIINDARDFAMANQCLFACDWADHIYDEFLLFSLLSNKINLPISKIEKYREHEFRGRTFQSLRPLEDQQALALAVEHGNGSRTEHFRGLNLNVDDVFAELGHEEDLSRQFGVPIRNQGGTTSHNLGAGVS